MAPPRLSEVPQAGEEERVNRCAHKKKLKCGAERAACTSSSTARECSPKKKENKKKGYVGRERSSSAFSAAKKKDGRHVPTRSARYRWASGKGERSHAAAAYCGRATVTLVWSLVRSSIHRSWRIVTA